jgi:hypothetical protein
MAMYIDRSTSVGDLRPHDSDAGVVNDSAEFSELRKPSLGLETSTGAQGAFGLARSTSPSLISQDSRSASVPRKSMDGQRSMAAPTYREKFMQTEPNEPVKVGPGGSRFKQQGLDVGASPGTRSMWNRAASGFGRRIRAWAGDNNRSQRLVLQVARAYAYGIHMQGAVRSWPNQAYGALRSLSNKAANSIPRWKATESAPSSEFLNNDKKKKDYEAYLSSRPRVSPSRQSTAGSELSDRLVGQRKPPSGS